MPGVQCNLFNSRSIVCICFVKEINEIVNIEAGWYKIVSAEQLRSINDQQSKNGDNQTRQLEQPGALVENVQQR